MKHDSIPMVRAAFQRQFTVAMINNHLSPTKYYEKVGLPIHEQEDADSLLPVKPFWHLINMVAREEGINDFGAQVAKFTPWHKVESLRPYLIDSETLEDLLTSFCKCAKSQSNRADFLFSKNKNESSFMYTGSPLFRNDVQMEFYRICCMIQLVQLATGQQWHPKAINIVMKKNKLITTYPLLKPSKISFDQKLSGFSIKTDLLSMPVIFPPESHVFNSLNYDINANYPESLQHIIRVYIHYRNCTIEDIALATDQSVRSIQRQLKKHGISFNDLLNEAKFILAKEKLIHTDISISEISLQLGYSDSSHFNRAFKRWSGISPSDYRSNN